MVTDAHLKCRIGEQAHDNCGADHAGAAGDQHSAHPLATSAAISEL